MEFKMNQFLEVLENNENLLVNKFYFYSSNLLFLFKTLSNNFFLLNTSFALINCNFYSIKHIDNFEVVLNFQSKTSHIFCIKLVSLAITNEITHIIKIATRKKSNI